MPRGAKKSQKKTAPKKGGTEIQQPLETIKRMRKKDQASANDPGANAWEVARARGATEHGKKWGSRRGERRRRDELNVDLTRCGGQWTRSRVCPALRGCAESEKGKAEEWATCRGQMKREGRTARAQYCQEKAGARRGERAGKKGELRGEGDRKARKNCTTRRECGVVHTTSQSNEVAPKKATEGVLKGRSP